ncbi:GNAT family N-acetyltransferase [Neobacillus cucumis]|uniref:GNAT family N-acetyltransferase n=1 Tax=Neobacillus cucumis TaxID=1740721 RepID=UPI00203FE2CB|nr:GNAT family N-acetyltransferase [Neobacillus cucumis]MCM3729182.1 GNAT family N-acetyltransferase [Neobacillus cucumis]
MINFEENTFDKKQIEMDIMNSNPDYNLISKNKETIEEQDIIEEFQESKDLNVVRLLVKNDQNYIGILDYCLSNLSDGKTWISLFVIHRKYQGNGLAKKVYIQFENLIKEKEKTAIRLAVHQINQQGIRFWNSFGFTKYKELIYNDKVHYCLEKKIGN